MKIVIITLIILVTINVNAAVESGSVGVSEVEEKGVGINAVEEGVVGVTQLGNGYIQVCSADEKNVVSCIITKG